MSDLNKRNTETVVAQIRDIDLMVRSQRMDLDNLARTVGGLINQITLLEGIVAAMRIDKMGRGPTA